jgi:hypothetical protein
MASYTASSPWGKTGSVRGRHLDILNIRPVPAEDDDILYEVESQYTHRPDLLSYDLYGTPKLWWVFAQRNMDVIKDPIYDLRAGVKIYLPKVTSLKTLLGL